MRTKSTHVGAFEAKTKLAALLQTVGQGGSVVITKHDRPIARLVPYNEVNSQARKQAVTGLRVLRLRYRWAGLEAKDLRAEGRQ